MGKVKRVVTVLIFILISISCVYASEITYVYSNSVSSADIETFKVGDTFKDEDKNLLVVSHKRDNIAEFDIVKPGRTVRMGSELTKRFPAMLAEACAGRKSLSLALAAATSFYPVSPMVDIDSDYKISTFLAMAGLRVDIPLKNFTDNSFILLKNGFGFAYSLFGADIKNSLNIVSKSGFGYRVTFGNVFVSASYIVKWDLESDTSVSDFAAGFGVII